MHQTTTTLNHIPLVRVKVVDSCLIAVAIQTLTMMSSAKALKEAVHSKAVEVELVLVTQDQEDADIKQQVRTLTVRTPTLVNSLFYLNFKPSADRQAASASMVTLLAKEILQALRAIASNIHAKDLE